MTERLEVTTHFLEMRTTPKREPVDCPPRAEIRLSTLTASAYLKLYESVGIPWLWYERSTLPKNELQSLISDDRVEIYLLKFDGIIAGYSELRFDDNGAQIVYFGLKQEFIGLGLGRYFLDWTVRYAFSKQSKRLRVHTCSLDHPRALTTYEQVGFAQYQSESGWVRIPPDALRKRDEHRKMR